MKKVLTGTVVSNKNAKNCSSKNRKIVNSFSL